MLGSVRDTSGAVVAGAAVTLTNTGTGISATAITDADGSYEFFAVRVGSYRLTARKLTFSTATADDVAVGIGARQRVDLVLAVGQARETVQVTGDVSLLETDSSERGQAISRRQAVELPLNGREYSALVALTTGARLSMGTMGQPNAPREGSFNVNGLPSTLNNFLLDGTDNNSYGTSNQGFSNQVMQPPPDAVAELKVVTNNMSAEYGRSGGATINVAYLSGGNTLNGSIWEFYRDTGLNATGFFKPVDGQKPPLRRNQFGFVLGGPIRKDKAFFFVDYEGFRQARKQVAFASVPDAAQRQGILTVPVRHPITGEQFPAGSPIPVTGFASQVLEDLPFPNLPGAANNYQALQELENASDKYGVKLDAQLSPRLRAFVRFGQRDADMTEQPLLPLPSGGGGNGVQYVRNRQLATGWTFLQSDASLWEFRFGYSRAQGGKYPPALGSPSAQEAYGISGLPEDPRVAGGLPTQFITGYSDLGRQNTNPQWQFPTVFTPKLNYTRRLGRHSLKAGLEWQHVRTEVQDVSPLYGSDEYAGRLHATARQHQHRQPVQPGRLHVRPAQPLLAQQPPGRQRPPELVLWLPAGRLQAEPQPDPQPRRALRVRHAPVGGRQRPHELRPGQPHDGRGAGRVDLRAGARGSRPQQLRAEGGVRLVDHGKDGRARRLRDELRPLPARRLREPADDQRAAGDQRGRLAVEPDGSRVPTERAGYPEGITDPSRFNPPVANVTYIPRDHQSAEVHSWFLAVQREVYHGALVDVAYVENRGRNMLLFANYNQASPNDAQGSLPLAARRPIPGWGDITYAFDGGRSEYRALQLRFETRLKFGLVLLSSFTWSRALDNAAGPLEGANGDIPAPQDVHSLAADYGYSAYDQPYNSTTSLVWNCPLAAAAGS